MGVAKAVAHGDAELGLGKGLSEHRHQGRIRLRIRLLTLCGVKQNLDRRLVREGVVFFRPLKDHGPTRQAIPVNRAVKLEHPHVPIVIWREQARIPHIPKTGRKPSPEPRRHRLYEPVVIHREHVQRFLGVVKIEQPREVLPVLWVHPSQACADVLADVGGQHR